MITQMTFIFFSILFFGIYGFAKSIMLVEGDTISLNESMDSAGLIFFFTFYLFIIGIYLGSIQTAIFLIRNKPINIKMLFNCFNFLYIYILGQILLSVPVFFLELLFNSNLFIVRITISLFSSFYAFIIINEKIKNPILGLKKSFFMVRNHLNFVIPIYFILFISNIILGALTMFLGWIILLPVSLLCYTKLYLYIKGDKGLK